MKKTITIPEVNEEKFLKAIQKLTKLSRKLGSGEVECTFLSKEPQKHKEGYLMYCTYEIAGETPMLNGYRVMARMERVTKQNLVESYDPAAALPEGLENRENYCEHCNSNRQRRHLFLLQKEETGAYVQVGKTCLKDFTGAHGNPEHIAHWYGMLTEISDMDGMIPTGFSFEAVMLDVMDVLAYSAYLTKTNGYVRTMDGTEDEPSTAHTVKRVLRSDRKPTIDRAYYELAEEVKAWVLRQEAVKYGYMKDLQTLISAPAMSAAKVGIVASAYVAYLKATEKEQQQQLTGKPLSSFVGEIGDKKTYTLTYDREHGYSTDYGWVTMYFFHDADHNVFMWRTSLGFDFEEGEQLQLKGTLKDHSEYGGVKQNILTRCKVIE